MHIERLIQEGHLGRYVQGRGGSNQDKRAAPGGNTSRSPKRGRGKEKAQDKEVEEGHERNNRGTVNTIAGGFSGGGSTSSARRRYSRSTHSCNAVGVYAFKEHPQLAFTFDDFGETYPHEDDPLVISVPSWLKTCRAGWSDLNNQNGMIYHASPQSTK